MKRKAAPTKTVRKLRKLRRDREWSLHYLGSLVGVSHAAISQFETGERSPSDRVAKELARALGCSVDELLDPVEIPA